MTANKKKIDITPDTKIGALLESFPDLETLLIEMAPSFAKLQNPLLRRTVAKVTSLRQAATVGGVDLSTLINTLRKAIGADNVSDLEEDGRRGPGERPDWSRPENVTQSLDAREMITRGEHPIGTVLEQINTLPEGSAYELITPFVPAPLIEIAESKGVKAWWFKEDDELVRTFFCR